MENWTFTNDVIDKNISNLIPKSVAQKHRIVPIKKNEDILLVAMADPYNFIAREDIGLYTNLKIESIKVEEKEIQELIDISFGKDDEDRDSDLLSVADLIDKVIEDAIEKGVSDIHIEPNRDNIRIRFRLDGELFTVRKISLDNYSSIVSRIKVIGNMDIAEKRVPQDGRIEIIVNNQEVDIRLSTMPTIFGEKVVLRLLNKTSFNYEISNLGLNKNNLQSFKDIISQPYGMILITGPTGCGKSTTMYTILKDINVIERNVVTVEDPVEYQIPGINQIQVNYKAGLDFASGLKSILRQDPDYIFIGEIRDQETSRLAVRAAITGHLLFSTLHTNDSVSAIHRLIDMGIEPYLLSSSLIGVISQRLIKLLCPLCKESYEPSVNVKRVLGLEGSSGIYLFKAVGCHNCNNGYLGRTAIYEVLKIDNKVRNLIDGSSNSNKIKDMALKNGLTTLFDSAKELLLSGKTSYEEAIKIKTT